MGKKIHLYVSVVLLLSGCSPSSLDDFRHEGEAICKKLTQELREIDTHDKLMKKAPKLKLYFDQLASLMIEVKKLEPDDVTPIIDEESLASQALLCELKRIYQIEAGREVIEKAQKEALIKLWTTGK